MPAELFQGKASNFSLEVNSLAITFIQFSCRRHPKMSSVEMNESEDHRLELLKVRTQQDVPITGVQIGVSQLIIQTLGVMSEKLKMRPYLRECCSVFASSTSSSKSLSSSRRSRR